MCVINSLHLEPFPSEPFNDGQGRTWNGGMINQSVLKVLCEKAMGNEHFAKVPVKRELRSSGCCSLMSVILFYVFCSLTSLHQTICACFFVGYLSYFLRVIPALRNMFFSDIVSDHLEVCKDMQHSI